MREEIKRYGFFELDTSEEEFLQLAHNLGSPVPSRRSSQFIDVIKPKHVEQAHKNSLSRLYGIGEFPFHTDGAYFTIPPKFILLRCAESIVDATPTKLLPILKKVSPGELELLSSEMWAVKGRSFNFYSPLVTKVKGENLIRFDSGCMSLISKRTYISELLKKEEVNDSIIRINWRKGWTVVIDNWSVLHARPEISELEKDIRTLQRIMINE